MMSLVFVPWIPFLPETPHSDPFGTRQFILKNTPGPGGQFQAANDHLVISTPQQFLEQGFLPEWVSTVSAGE